jgi:hypothetical protein
MTAPVLIAVLAATSLLHLAWALAGLPTGDWAIPSVPAPRGLSGGRMPAFKPTRLATAGVAFALALLAALVAWRAGLFGAAEPHPALRWALDGAALLMLARAVGDFRLVGLFQRAGDSPFVRRDRWLYSPLCVALGAGLFRVAHA